MNNHVKRLTAAVLPMLAASMFFMVSLLSADGDPAAMFPVMEGWSPKTSPALYNPDNLFEYIDGAAEVYLGFDFQELTSQGFVTADKKTFTVDIYRHADPRMAFGIYSQEKPRVGEFIAVGAEGYYEQGVLNFLKGNYYIKISGFELGADDRRILETAARQVSNRLSGDETLPRAVRLFPEKGKVPHSESFTAQNFLGHSFLNLAFKADYQDNGESFQLFIIETDDESAAAKMTDDYVAFARGKGASVEIPGNGRYFVFQDPYYRPQGVTHLKQSGRYVWGLIVKKPDVADYYMAEVGQKLTAGS